MRPVLACPVAENYNPMSPYARGLAQHGGPPGWQKSDPARPDYDVLDGRAEPSWIEPTTVTTPYVSIFSIFVYQLIDAGWGKCCVESGTVCV
jgi:hypothetical protein